ncbi:MICOS complex subunit MIC60 [Sphingopyxis sp. PET50]|uniref:MICOS complex subunit MIC60 n=1 Tax=Sphingopyxis sp. PET50 TaxID=2976533 RepID=UPI0021B048F1|nr:MICOS complex subunit MIC60 [Sphingopyxis sp. PET50]
MAIESSETPARLGAEPSSKGPSFRSLAIAALLLLLIGVVGGGWAMNRWLAGGEAAAPTVVDTAATDRLLAARAAAEAPAGVAAPAAALPGDPSTLPERVAELEQRLSRITLEAASASGNASRAEGLLVAFAVRRALDRGLPLGYLDAQLRLRFGDDQPNAVKTIIETSRDPVTLEQLRAELDAIAPNLVGRSGDNGSLWTGLRRELGELFVVRAAGTQSPRANERLERARRYLAGGMADKAIAEVEAMPGAAAAGEWLIDARRYHEARRALDLIETAAILEPRGGQPAATAGKVPAATTP